MEPGENDNVYAVYIIFTKNIISETEMVDKLLMHVQENSDLLYCRSCFDRENNQLNRFICCLNKKFYNHLVENCDFKRDSDFNITKYRNQKFLYKNIQFKINQQKHNYTERIEILYKEDFIRLCKKENLKLIECFGDYDLNKFSENSKRLILFFKKGLN